MSELPDSVVAADPPPVPDPGRVLRRAREDRGLTLLQAAEATKISPKYLEALEDGAGVAAFPAPIYARAFVRSYARYLELDDGPLVAGFAQRFRATDPPPRVVRALEEPSLERGAPPAGRTAIRAPEGRPPGQKRTPRRRGGGLTFGPRGRAARRFRMGRVPVMVGRAAPTAPTGGRHRVASTIVALTLTAAAAIVAMRLDLGGTPERGPDPPAAVGPAQRPELPRGGRRIFPEYRVVAYYGAARTKALGILGIGPDRALERLLEQAEPYEHRSRPVIPAFELIATVASRAPGEDGLYRMRQADTLIGGYLDAARDARMLLILDVQPGRSDFLTEVKVYEKYLIEPDVGLALDPEWHVGDGQVPGIHLGSVDARDVNRVAAWLSRLVQKHDLPEKLFIVHQFTFDMIKNKEQLRSYPGLATVVDIDGWGTREAKLSKYQALTNGFRERFRHGIKLYYTKDTKLLPPHRVLALSPSPDLIVYQ